MTHDLPALCRQIRRDILSMTHAAGSGHPGGSLSAVEILVSLYFGQMRLDPARPDDPNRDRFLLSKGHAAPLLYSVLARRGYFDPALLPTLRQLGSPLQGHPHMAKLPGLDCSSGSLGQGLSIANGLLILAACLPMAIGGLLSGIAQGRVAAASVNIVAKNPNDWSKGMVLCIIVEFYAILSLLISFLMIMFGF